eukprot:6102794-Pyramimonas_sp.AAC.1
MKRDSAGETEPPLRPLRAPVPAPPPTPYDALPRPSAALSFNLGQHHRPSPGRHSRSPLGLGVPFSNTICSLRDTAHPADQLAAGVAAFLLRWPQPSRRKAPPFLAVGFTS